MLAQSMHKFFELLHSLISSNPYPKAILAASFAIGYPVAFDAKAEDLETLGLISITAYSNELGFKANCTLHPPSIPTAFMMFIDAVLKHLIFFI